MSTNKRTLAFLAVLTIFAAAGCNKPETEGKVLATVNGTPITQRDVELSEQPSGHGPAKPAKDLDYLITEELFYQQGQKIGLDQDPGYKKQLARVEQKGHGMSKNSPGFRNYLASEMRSEMARRVFDTQIAAKVDVRMPEAKEYFEKNKETINTELHIGLIKYQNRHDAEQALQKIRAGEPFEALAEAAQKGKTATEKVALKGRPSYDLGFVPWGEIPIDFVEPLYKLKPGEVSGILGNQLAGFQLVKQYESRKTSRIIRFSDVSGSIMNGLRDLKIVQGHQQYVEQLKKEAKIVTF